MTLHLPSAHTPAEGRSSGRPLFSIITPTLNAGAHFDRGADSIRRQGRADVEHIVIDGGSRDDTLARVRANRDVVTQLLSEPDEGIYDAINKGILLARGELIGVLGADDSYEVGALDAIADAYGAQHQADLYAGQTRIISANGRARLRVDESFGRGALVSGIPFGHNAMFAPRKTYERIGLYDTSYRLCADAHWVHRSVKSGLSCVRLSKVLVNFPLTGQSSIQKENMLAESIRAIQVNFPFLSAEEARSTLDSVRGWASDTQLLRILERHNVQEFRAAVQTALADRPNKPVRLEFVEDKAQISLPGRAFHRSWRRMLALFSARRRT